jgi:hypothetical protein
MKIFGLHILTDRRLEMIKAGIKKAILAENTWLRAQFRLHGFKLKKRRA